MSLGDWPSNAFSISPVAVHTRSYFWLAGLLLARLASVYLALARLGRGFAGYPWTAAPTGPCGE